MTGSVQRAVNPRRMPLPFVDDELTPNQLLARYHYLGPINRGDVYRDSRGVMVFANPSSRRLPQQRWGRAGALVHRVRYRLSAVEGRATLATGDVSRRDHGSQLLRSERGPYGRPVSRVRLVVGADMASTEDTAERQR